LNIKKAKALHDVLIETDERITVEDYDLNPFSLDKAGELQDPALVRTASGEIVRVLKSPSNVAICGSTPASQRVVDVILRAYGKCAAFAGCANSFGWGMGGKDR
jgi:hypothetical protein